jgi:ABC-2 type transport system permease protein
VRVYLEVARRAYARQSTYRAATVAGVFTNSVFGFLLAYVLLAVYSGRSAINGFTAADAVTFTFVSQGLFFLSGNSDLEQATRIGSGDVVIDLYRPIDYQGYWAAIDAGRSAYQLIFRGIPPFVVGWIAFDQVSLPPSAWLWPAFAVSVVLAVAVTSSFRFIVQSLAFWMLEIRGPNQMASLTAAFFAGSFVPLFLFPPALLAVARVLPFIAILQWPVEIFLGAHTGADLAAVLAAQAAWAVALALVGRWVLARATRKVVIQGG